MSISKTLTSKRKTLAIKKAHVVAVDICKIQVQDYFHIIYIFFK